MKEMRLMRAIGDIDDKYIEEAAPTEEKRTAVRFAPWTKFAGIAACAAVVIGAGVFAFTRNGGNIVDYPVLSGTYQTNEVSDSSEPDQYVNPFMEFDALAEAENTVGFEIVIPESYGDYSELDFFVVGGEILEIQYNDPNDTRGMLIRKIKGTEDVSGDYNEYSDVSEIQTAAGTVTIKGNDGRFYLAVWTFGEFSYSVSVSSGISEDELKEIVEKIQ